MSTLILFPGLAASAKLFDQYDFGEQKSLVIEFLVPLKNELLLHYCERLSVIIPRHEDLIFIGVSFGGILAQEISKMITPKKIILISTIKSESEKPFYFRIVKVFPLYKVISIKLLKWILIHFGPWVTPKSKEDRKRFLSMVKEADPKVIRWGIHQTLYWSQKERLTNIIHIHGSKDHIFPPGNIKADYVIEDGSHFMIIQRAEEINTIINHLCKTPAT